MGANLAKVYSKPSTELQPGTYRIANLLNHTCLEVPEDDTTKLVARSNIRTDKQKWFVQRAGGGYQFKHCESGAYLVTENTDSKALLCASEYPTTWVLHKQAENTFLLQFPLNDRVIHLEENSNSSNENEKQTKITLRAADSDGVPKNMKWRFEKVSNETVTDTVDIESLKQELSQTTQKLQESKEEIKRLRREIAEVTVEEMKAPRPNNMVD